MFVGAGAPARTTYSKQGALSQNHGCVVHYFGSSAAQKTTQTEGSDILVPGPNLKEIPEIRLCGILMLMYHLSYTIYSIYIYI